MSHSSTSYAALSIHHVVRLHPRERLWVHPLLWTARHLELLQVTFEEPVHAPDCLPPDQEELTWKPYAARWAQQLFVEVSSSLWKGREYRLARLLTAPGTPFVSVKQLPIYFNRRLVSLVECPVLFLTHDCEKVYAQRVPPVAAIIDRGHIDEERACHARSKGRSSKPTNALFDTKLKQLTPRNPFHDPYIVALLIAVAHIQRYVQQKGDGEKQVDTSVYFAQLIFMNSDDKDHIHLFAANIPSSFLGKMEFPTVAPATPPPAVAIRHTIIPLKTTKTFRHRVFQLLLPAYNIPKLNLQLANNSNNEKC